MKLLIPLPTEIPLTIQDLPPKWAHLSLEVATFIEKTLGIELKGKGVLIAVSGGVDSVCLLILLKVLQGKLNLLLEVAHLDHGFRTSSSQEANWVKALCKSMNIPCHVKQMCTTYDDGDKKTCTATGLEEKGRNWRYTFFETIRQKQNLDFVALAHNLNDLAEDQLMRLLRGCGWPELGGMPGFDPKRALIRPILMQPRTLLQEMLDKLNIPCIVDESNSSDLFMRNRVRMNLMPQLTQENTGYLEHSKNLWTMAQLDQVFWNDYLNQVEFIIEDNQLILPFSAVLLHTEAARLRIFRFCLQKLSELLNLPAFFTPAPQLFEINQSISRRKTGQGSGLMRIQFPGGAEVVIGKKEIIFCCPDKSS